MRFSALSFSGSASEPPVADPGSGPLHRLVTKRHPGARRKAPEKANAGHRSGRDRHTGQVDGGAAPHIGQGGRRTRRIAAKVKLT